MGIASGMVLYLVIWFMTFLVALPIRVQTQGEAGEVVPGTHHGSPEKHHLKKKAWIVTWVAFALWIIASGIILSGWISVDDLEAITRGQNN